MPHKDSFVPNVQITVPFVPFLSPKMGFFLHILSVGEGKIVKRGAKVTKKRQKSWDKIEKVGTKWGKNGTKWGKNGTAWDRKLEKKED